MESYSKNSNKIIDYKIIFGLNTKFIKDGALHLPVYRKTNKQLFELLFGTMILNTLFRSKKIPKFVRL